MSWLARLLYGDESKAWDKACRKDTPKAYKRFASRFPSSTHAQAARRKREELEWKITREKDTIEGYDAFLRQHAGGVHREDATSRITKVTAQREAIRNAVYRILPANVQGQVQFSERKSGCTLHISAHLLNAYSPDDTSPLVRGAYGSHTGLYAYVKRRIAEIYRTVFTSAQTLRLEEVIVECKHGVRHVVVGGPGSGDYATDLYTTSMRGNTAKDHDWAKVTDAAIQKMWEVRTDVIPSVQFQYA